MGSHCLRLRKSPPLQIPWHHPFPFSFEYILLKLLLKTLQCWDFQILYTFLFSSFSFLILPFLSLLYTFFAHFFSLLRKGDLRSYLGGNSSLYHQSRCLLLASPPPHPTHTHTHSHLLLALCNQPHSFFNIIMSKSTWRLIQQSLLRRFFFPDLPFQSMAPSFPKAKKETYPFFHPYLVYNSDQF